jgi:hypothetical protein
MLHDGGTGSDSGRDVVFCHLQKPAHSSSRVRAMTLAVVSPGSAAPRARCSQLSTGRGVARFTRSVSSQPVPPPAERVASQLRLQFPRCSCRNSSTEESLTARLEAVVSCCGPVPRGAYLKPRLWPWANHFHVSPHVFCDPHSPANVCRSTRFPRHVRRTSARAGTLIGNLISR